MSRSTAPLATSFNRRSPGIPLPSLRARCDLAWRLALGFTAVSLQVATAAEVEPPKPTAHEIRQIAGWQVRVDDRLLHAPEEELGGRALRLLETKLDEIASVMAPDRLAKLREVSIVLDLTHGGLRSMQYHPSAGWLRNNGYSTNLAKCVHIPRAKGLVDARQNNRMPWVVLHELAHAYHDQALGFDDPEIKAAWRRFVDSGRYESILLIDGRLTRHYALTDQKEFFAEMTEAYFGMNDFFPFNRAELKQEEPELFELLCRIWGPPPS